jgi:predicted alpha/beta superfamily hydrolase
MRGSPRYAALVLTWAALLLPRPGMSQEAPILSSTRPMLGSVASFTLPSKELAEQYQISIYLPAEYYQTDRVYPVVVLPDAFYMFGTVRESLDLLIYGGEVPPQVVVGIGYEVLSEGDWVRKRVRDFTHTMPSAYPDAGRAGAFLRMILDDLLPTVSRGYRVDLSDMTLVGNSLGGLFSTWVLLTHPEAFQRIIIGSPPFWWDQEVMLRLEEEAAGRLSDLPVEVFTSVGEKEGAGQVSRWERFVTALRARDYPGLQLEAVIFPGETHTSVTPFTLSRGLRYLLAEEPERRPNPR